MIVFSCTVENDDLYNEGVNHQKNAESKAVKSSEKVNLVKAWTSYSFYRGYGTYNRRFMVSVANLAYEKRVSVYHEKKNGTWEEISMSYVENIDGDRELWELDNIEFGIETLADQFVIKYEVDGEVYWDNNQGNNYQMSRQEGYFFAQPALNISVDNKFTSVFYSSYEDKNIFRITADVRNIDPTKDVRVVYTTNGWETKNDFPLSFVGYWYNGYNAVLISPNDFGIERWDAGIRLDKSINQIEFALVYKVNGQEYWDNNYGKNYTLHASN